MPPGKGLKLHCSEWAGIQKSLDFVTAQLAQHSQLIFTLDPLGNRADVEALGQLDDGAHDRAVVTASGEIPHKRGIDLEFVDPKTLEVA